MTEAELVDALKSRFTRGMAQRYGQAIVESDLFCVALDLGLDANRAVAFHASYALERAFFMAPDQFDSHVAHFVENYLVATNPSTHRHYSKIMAHLLGCGRVVLDDVQRQQVAEATFDRLIDPEVRPGVKVWAMEILANVSKNLSWVNEQLYDTIQFQMRHGEPALCSRGRKICRRILAQHANGGE